MLIYSDEQKAVFEEFRTGKGNVVVQAYAGCAKTTTVVEGITYAPERNILMCAFAKVNADELVARIKNPRATSRTLHSAGNSVIYKRAGRINVDDRRGRNIAEAVLRREMGRVEPTYESINLVAKLASLGKNIAPFTDVRGLLKIADDFDIVPKNEDLGDDEAPLTVDLVARAAYLSMERACEYDGSIDFDDMIFLPVRKQWVQAQYDLVVVDEYQDMNPTQLMLARKLCKGRMFLVGDKFQAIYEFRGADADFASTMVKELSAKVMTLHTTFRCPKAVVREAAKLVPGYEAAPEAPEGVVRELRHEAMFDAAKPGDFILSRKNAPLAKVCLRLLREGKRALIRGKKIGDGLVSIIKGRDARSIPEFLENLGEWEKNVVAGYVAQKAPEAKIELVQDQAATLSFLAEGLATVKELIARVQSLFDDATPGNAVVCSSVHRAKGLEAERVFFLVDTLYPGGRRNEEEEHIHYVGLTRTKRELMLVRAAAKA